MMQRSILFAVLIVVAWLPSPSFAQIKWHSDYGGYTIKSGNSQYSFRNDGSSQTFHRFGNIGLYSDSAGTSGSSIYGLGGRHDSYQNYQREWSGSGYTPYQNPSATTYRRYSTAPYPEPKSSESSDGFRFETTSSGRMAYPTLPGTSLRDYSKSGFRIEDDGDRTTAYPTLPGTSTRDYSKAGIVLRAPTSGDTRSVTGGRSSNPGSVRDYDPRESTVARINRLGVKLDWQKMSHSQLLDAESRISTANRIGRDGIELDWTKYTSSELLDKESRISTARRIARDGVRVDWQSATASQLLDIESRVSSSQRISRLGESVDWRTHSLSQLLDMESRISSSGRLARKGINVNWRNHTLSTLLAMESRP